MSIHNPHTPKTLGGHPAPKTHGGRLTHGQMPCPDCQQPIALPFERLIAGHPIFCSHCGISLQAKTDQNAEAFAALRRARQMIDELQST